MRIQILDQAERDLIDGYHFYESQTSGLGSYFLTSLNSDIELLRLNGGTHPKVNNYHRMVAHRFPFAIFYRVKDNTVFIRAVLDCRRNPAWIRERLRKS